MRAGDTRGRATLLAVVVLVSAGAQSRAQAPEASVPSSARAFTRLEGPYLGQAPPGREPKLFAPGVVSTERRELNSVFTPDGNEFYFAYSLGQGRYTIMRMQQLAGRWTQPEVAPFSRRHSNVDLSISADGSLLFFGSNRPRGGESSPRRGFDLWVARRSGEDWGEPENLGAGVNSGDHQIYPTVSAAGTLYFQSRRDGGFGGTDIYRARAGSGGYSPPENLGPTINTRYDEGDVLIAPDESFMIVSVDGRPDSLGRGDLYIAFRDPEGAWGELVNMGAPINSDKIDFCPMLSPDGAYLFFSSGRRGTPDIYWVDAGVIDSYRAR